MPLVDQPGLLLEEVVAIALDLLSVESPQADIDRVKACIASEIRPRAASAGFDEVGLDPDGNLIALRRGDPDLEPLLIYTYAGTYPAAGMLNPYPAREIEVEGRGRCLRGRAAAEQRSGLAAALVGVGSYLRQAASLRRGLLFVTSIAGEMGNHEVVSRIRARQLRASMGVLAVATENTLCLGNRGRIDLQVAVHGYSAHSSNPSAGLNAIEGAVEFLTRVATLALPEDPALGRATMTPVTIESWPKASHTIPDEVRMTLDRRLLPGEDPALIVDGLRQVAQRVDRYRIDVELGDVSFPNMIAPDADVARQVGAAMQAAGVPFRTTYKKSALDAGYLTHAGIPTVLFGPGQPHLAHTDEEYVAVDELYAAARVFYHLAHLASGG